MTAPCFLTFRQADVQKSLHTAKADRLGMGVPCTAGRFLRRNSVLSDRECDGNIISGLEPAG